MVWWTVGCVYGATSVMLGAFGAHGLKKSISDPARLANWSTAAQYQVCFTKLETFSLCSDIFLTSKVDPQRRITSVSISGTKEPSCCNSLHCRNDNVFGQHLSFGLGPSAIQSSGTSHSDWRTVFDCRMGSSCFRQSREDYSAISQQGVDNWIGIMVYVSLKRQPLFSDSITILDVRLFIYWSCVCAQLLLHLQQTPAGVCNCLFKWPVHRSQHLCRR